jgi:flagellin
MSRINTNISSIQAMHRLTSNQADLSLRLERLSSGLRINKGSDDPAGLIASESLRSEIAGLTQAIDNSTRANNVIATAEGSLNEVSSLLLQMRSLINQSANEGALSPPEIEANQLQIDSILASIDRIANTTQFNGVKLLNGGLDYTLSAGSHYNSSVADMRVYSANIPEGATQGVMIELANSADVAKYNWAQSVVTGGNATIQIGGNKGSQILNFVSGMKSSAMRDVINNSRDLTGVSASLSTNNTLILSSVAYGSSQYVSVDVVADGTGDWTEAKNQGRDADIRINGIKATTDGLTGTVRGGGLDVSMTVTALFGTGGVAGNSATFDIKGGGALFQLGPDVAAVAQYRMGIQSIATSTLGDTTSGRLSQIGRDGVYSISGGNYQQAQKIVDTAIQQVATLRGRLGGFQKNQLQTNINSQQIALENAKASESAIRDADYATETANMTRAQILVQSTTQILAMANQQPQNVLTLLGR